MKETSFIKETSENYNLKDEYQNVVIVKIE